MSKNKASITTMICEDEPLARETLRDWIATQPQLVLIAEATNGRDALAMIRQLQPALVFMDIQMPHMTGLEVVKQLDCLPQLIFTTAYDQHAVTAFELNAVDYLLKPFSQARFNEAVERVLLTNERPNAEALQNSLQTQSASSPLSRILVRDRGQIFPLSVDEIQYIKADSKYTQIAARGSSYLVRVPISDLEARLDAKRFLRIHRSTVINLDFVQAMKPDEQSQLEIRMLDGTVHIANREASRLLRDQSF
jgi:two-component system, LytTR family, response regulator